MTGTFQSGIIKIPNVTDDIIITAIATAISVTSISAVYYQSSSVYTTDSLDVLKKDLIITATYSDGHSAAVDDYTLSGTLTQGTSTISVLFGGQTDSFDVIVSVLELITDGLDLYFNLRNGSSGLTDSINGVVATNTNGEFVNGGLKLPSSNANMAWQYPVATNIPNGFTIEYAASIYGTVHSSSVWLPYLAAGGTGWGGGYAFQFAWNNGTTRSGFAYNVNGELQKPSNIYFSQDAFTGYDFDSEHTVSVVWNVDSSVDVYIDGIRIGGRSVLADFDNYVVSGTMKFRFPYTTNANFPNFTIAELRFYNRALSASEVLINYKTDEMRR